MPTIHHTEYELTTEPDATGAWCHVSFLIAEERQPAAKIRQIGAVDEMRVAEEAFQQALGYGQFEQWDSASATLHFHVWVGGVRHAVRVASESVPRALRRDVFVTSREAAELREIAVKRLLRGDNSIILI